MLKNKELRDNTLLIVMGVVVLIFLVYIFIPSGGKGGDNDKSNGEATHEKKSPPDKIEKKHGEKDKDDAYPNQMNRLLEFRLKETFQFILNSNRPFEKYSDGLLKKTFLDAVALVKDPELQTLLKKYHKISFEDLADIFTFQFPTEFKPELRFNLFLTQFLIQVRLEKALQRLGELSSGDLAAQIDFRCYRLLRNELLKDYQALPILFYFTALLDRMNIYPPKENTLGFVKKLNLIKDLSPNKITVVLKDYLRFSSQLERFRLKWEEDDGLGSKDEKTYHNLPLRSYRFLKQVYLLFPATRNVGANQWLKDLSKADHREIELSQLNVYHKTRPQELSIKKIIYSPLHSQFVILLKGIDQVQDPDFLQKMVNRKISIYLRKFQSISFDSKFLKKKEFEEQLIDFGHYIAKLVKNMSPNQF